MYGTIQWKIIIYTNLQLIHRELIAIDQNNAREVLDSYSDVVAAWEKSGDPIRRALIKAMRIIAEKQEKRKIGQGT